MQRTAHSISCHLAAATFVVAAAWPCPVLAQAAGTATYEVIPLPPAASPAQPAVAVTPAPAPVPLIEPAPARRPASVTIQRAVVATPPTALPARDVTMEMGAPPSPMETGASTSAVTQTDVVAEPLPPIPAGR